MVERVCALVALFAFAWGCGRDVYHATPDLQVTIHRSNGLYPGPTYSITVRGDGQVTFVGERFVAASGTHTKNVSPEVVDSIVRKLDEIDFFDLDSYGPGDRGCKEYRTDQLSVTITVASARRKKTVSHYLGCPGRKSTDRLRELQDLVERSAEIEEWARYSLDGETRRDALQKLTGCRTVAECEAVSARLTKDALALYELNDVDGSVSLVVCADGLVSSTDGGLRFVSRVTGRMSEEELARVRELLDAQPADSPPDKASTDHLYSLAFMRAGVLQLEGSGNVPTRPKERAVVDELERIARTRPFLAEAKTLTFELVPSYPERGWPEPEPWPAIAPRPADLVAAPFEASRWRALESVLIGPPTRFGDVVPISKEDAGMARAAWLVVRADGAVYRPLCE